MFIGGDPHHSGLAMDYFVWVARNELHTVVMDTGFDQAAARERGRQLLLEPGEGLRRLGVDCAEVRHVIITHLHYDHAGNLPLFPRARFHLQDREMAFATGRHMAHPFFAHAYELEGVLSVVRLAYGARVQFHDGDAEIVPGHQRAPRGRSHPGPAGGARLDAPRLAGAWPPMPATIWPT